MPHLTWRLVALGLVARAALAAGQVPGACDTPATQRTGPTGCYFLDTLPVPPTSDPLYWYIFKADSTTAPVPGTRLIHAHNQSWLMAIAGAQVPFPATLIARVGPLTTPNRHQHAVARIMESTLTEGIRTRLHSHPGPEAWYLLSGAQCLETPDGAHRVRAHESLVVHGDQPMVLTATGPDTMRSLVLVLHEATHPWIDRSPTSWSPSGECRR